MGGGKWKKIENETYTCTCLTKCVAVVVVVVAVAVHVVVVYSLKSSRWLSNRRLKLNYKRREPE